MQLFIFLISNKKMKIELCENFFFVENNWRSLCWGDKLVLSQIQESYGVDEIVDLRLLSKISERSSAVTVIEE